MRSNSNFLMFDGDDLVRRGGVRTTMLIEVFWLLRIEGTLSGPRQGGGAGRKARRREGTEHRRLALCSFSNRR